MSSQKQSRKVVAVAVLGTTIALAFSAEVCAQRTAPRSCGSMVEDYAEPDQNTEWNITSPSRKLVVTFLKDSTYVSIKDSTGATKDIPKAIRAFAPLAKRVLQITDFITMQISFVEPKCDPKDSVNPYRVIESAVNIAKMDLEKNTVSDEKEAGTAVRIVPEP